MANKDKNKYNEYMRKYVLSRYHERRNTAIANLGGKCVKCGATDRLELDHIDATTKTLDIAKMWSVAETTFLAEIAKCQLLCNQCHIAKSIIDRGYVSARGTHGTLSAYRYCKCELCKAAKTDYVRKNAEKHNARRRARRKAARLAKEQDNISPVSSIG